ncbi:hypothetical protein SAMN04515647_0741 [Cohaesibacter sp. ES.047]|uniref:class I SAM-dependent methyltransferase n=1 Tax=Cohaesibacter sp. ES.047 TaxID=1798205 RepID=UPI000BB71734|nr:class I SAM-dependent methyltransferase [Cohaesibacter sp. ES.047]SNY90571.1 hypothetical protein SAMN04515647_0741 [Cohaesibacter sp. ES.047]
MSFLVRHLTDYSNPNSLGSRMRAKRMRRIEEILKDVINEKGSATILDVGGLMQYWMALDNDLAEHCHVIVLSDEPSEGHFDDLAGGFVGTSEFRQGDGCNLSEYADCEFDLVHSNSVVEHVGNFDRKKQFSIETKRVGRNYYVQTPNLWFPIDPHYLLPFVHWVAAPYRFKRLAHKGLGPRNPAMHDYERAVHYIEHTDILDKELFTHLFSDCEIFYEKAGPLIKSFIGIRRAPKQS